MVEAACVRSASDDSLNAAISDSSDCIRASNSARRAEFRCAMFSNSETLRALLGDCGLRRVASSARNSAISSSFSAMLALRLSRF